MIINPSATFDRPTDTTAYASGDLVANSTTAGEVIPLKFNISKLPHKSGVVGYARLFKNHQTVTNATFNLHLFSQSPTVTNGDNGAVAVSTAQYYLGIIAIDMTTGAFVTATDSIKRERKLDGTNAGLITFDISSDPAAREIFGLLEATAAYAPQNAEVFEVTLEIAANGGRDQ